MFVRACQLTNNPISHLAQICTNARREHWLDFWKRCRYPRWSYSPCVPWRFLRLLLVYSLGTSYGRNERLLLLELEGSSKYSFRPLPIQFWSIHDQLDHLVSATLNWCRNCLARYSCPYRCCTTSLCVGETRPTVYPPLKLASVF